MSRIVERHSVIMDALSTKALESSWYFHRWHVLDHHILIALFVARWWWRWRQRRGRSVKTDQSCRHETPALVSSNFIVGREVTLRLIQAVLDTMFTYTLAAAIMEPTINTCTHGSAKLFALGHTKMFVYESNRALEFLEIRIVRYHHGLVATTTTTTTQRCSSVSKLYLTQLGVRYLQTCLG